MTGPTLATDCGACRHTLNWHQANRCRVKSCPCVGFTDADLSVLLPLQQLIDRTLRNTPVRAGHPADMDRLSALLTVNVCAWIGRNVLPTTTPESSDV